MLRPRPLAMVLAALALLAGALLYASAASTLTREPMLSPTPPVALAPAPTTTTAAPALPRLPKTGFESGLLALIGLGLVAAGTALRGRTRLGRALRGWPGLGTSLLTGVGVGLVVAEMALRPQARPASRRHR